MVLTKQVNFDHTTIIRIFLISQTICLLPMFVTDLALIYNYGDNCLYAQNTAIFTLAQWVFYDGFIKLAVYVFVLFINVIQTELKNKQPLVVVCGNLLRFYYLFDFGWTVTASILFWGYFDSSKRFRTYQFCQQPYKGYLFFLLIFSYIIIPINLFISSFRSQDGSYSEQDTMPETRRNTQLIEKQRK